jgi:outer membrane immunogenic protein
MTRWYLPLAAFALALPAPALAQTDDPGSWSGFYVGGEVGLGSGKLHASATDNIFQLSNEHPAAPGSPNNPLIVVPSTTRGFAGSDSQSGLLYGAFAGGQIQTGHVVLGIEADAHGGRDAGSFSLASTLPPTLLAPTSNLTQARDLRINYDWSVRARLGIVTGQSLIYATGGVAQARVRVTGEDSFSTPAGAAAAEIPPVPTFQSPAIGPVVVTFSEHARLTGWTAGLGGERRIGRHLGIGLDARYADYGSRVIDFHCGFQSARNGTCGSYATPPIVIYGVTHGANDTTPGAEPGPTRVSLNEWRLSARLIFRF